VSLTAVADFFILSLLVVLKNQADGRFSDASEKDHFPADEDAERIALVFGRIAEFLFEPAQEVLEELAAAVRIFELDADDGVGFPAGAERPISPLLKPSIAWIYHLLQVFHVTHRQGGSMITRSATSSIGRPRVNPPAEKGTSPARTSPPSESRGHNLSIETDLGIPTPL